MAKALSTLTPEPSAILDNHPFPYSSNHGGFVFAGTQINGPVKCGQAGLRQIDYLGKGCNLLSHIRSDFGHTGEGFGI